MTRAFLLSAAATLVAGAAVAQDANTDFYGGPPEVPSFEPDFPEQWRAPIAETGYEIAQDVVTRGLVHPWGVDELPDGRLIVTEQPGRMRLVHQDGSVSAPIENVPAVYYTDQGGLLDVVLAPDFEETRELFFTYSDGDDETNRTALAKARLSMDGARLEGVETIWRQEPSWDSDMHYGSRIVFQDDDTLWVGLGDRFGFQSRELAQALDTELGKVVRLDRDGNAAEGNPFDGPAGALDTIWSYGHRNIQAMARHPETGELWEIEHGPKGGDEINIARAGRNYGWPVVSYGEQYRGGPIGEGVARLEGDDAMTQPTYYWSPVIAPSGAAFYEGEMFPDWNGDLLVGGLVTKAVIRLELDGDRVAAEDRMVRGIGRVRDIEVMQDGSIVVAIDAEDGSLIRLSQAESDT